MARYRYLSCHPVTRAQLHNSMALIDPKWSWIVGGNGTLSARITVPSDPRQVERIRVATQPKQAAIYVRNNTTGNYPWGGFVVGREWDTEANQITIECVEWRGWPYFTIFPVITDQWSYTQQDQLAIARDLMQFNINEYGSPPMTFDSSLSGRLRDLSFYRTDLKRIGPLIDSMANRDDGFEWTIQTRQGNDGLPHLHLLTGYPQLGIGLSTVMFKYTPGGGNMLPGKYKEDASNSVETFYATGAGQPPMQPVAVDYDPNGPTNQILRFDGGTNYNSITDVNTLASHARRARKYYQPGVNLVTVELGLDQVDVDSYSSGDRVRMVWKDRWQDLDLAAVRIVEKRVDMSGTGKAVVTLDLTDDTLPEVDAGGGV